MATSPTSVLKTALRSLLRPLVRICLRNGLSAKSFFEVTKHVYVDVAKAEYGDAGKPATLARIAITTGLTRKEVHRLAGATRHTLDADIDRYNRAAAVIGGWMKDPEFVNDSSQPLPLRMAEGPVTFVELVKRYSGDMPPRAMLDELLRVGAVKQLRDGQICLMARGYVPEKSPTQKLAILGLDTADLIATIDHNLYGDPRHPRYQRKVMYDNVSVETAKAFEAIAAARAQELLEELDRWLAHRDRDVNPAARGTGRARVGLGLYHFEESADADRIDDTTSNDRTP
ncbi:MAG: DUF6502 family protein [Nitrospiraceae bacterium]